VSLRTTLPTTIVDPEKVAWKGEATQVVFGISDGLVGILPGHADAAFALTPAIAVITTLEGSKIKLFLSGGVARISKGELTIVADSAELPEQIDRQRAEKAKERAEQRLSQAHREIDYERARLALFRALYRLEISQ
jgi:F-type H+-transporting ATPase subunit epsilon